MTQELATLRIDKTGWAHARSGRGKRMALWLAAVVLLAVGAAWAVMPGRPQVRVAAVARMYPTQAMAELVSSGYVTAQRKASLASKITSRLEWLGVEEGSLVQAGQVVAQLERADAEAQLDRARAEERAAAADRDRATAELDDATRNEARMRKLVAANVVARADYDAAQARLESAQAAQRATVDRLASARANRSNAGVSLEYCAIRAPFAGVVLTKNADVGDIITPLGAASSAKASVVTIADMGSLLVEADVSETSVSRIRVGMPCEIMLDALPEQRFPARVHMIVPTADRSKASVMVKVRFDALDARVLPEMSARVAFLAREPQPEDRAPRVVVPQAAVLATGTSPQVFVVRDGRVSRVAVRTGALFGDMVEIVEGVAPGARVVLSPPASLEDGDRVKEQA